MILSLSVKNYALIEDLTLNFKEGFTAITGETGSGKSILIEAMELICGKRADTSAIRSGCLVCSISGSFSFENPQVSDFLNSLSIPSEDNIVLIRRTIETGGANGSGRSKAFINDCQVNISTLASLGELLIDFHSQDEKYSLNTLETQLSVLDSKIKDAAPLLNNIKSLYEQIVKLKDELEAINLSDSQREHKIDLYSFQTQEINEASLEAGEDEKLESELPKLKNSEKISSLCQEIREILYSNESAVLSVVSKAKKNIESLNSLGIDASEILSLIEQSSYQIEEVYRSVDDILSKTDINPEKLNSALERNEMIKKLKRKYGSTISEILAYNEKIKSELDYLNNFKANTEKIEAELEQKSKGLLSICDTLTQKRKEASSRFCQSVKNELFDLEIKDAVFEIDFNVKEPSGNGQDKIEFMFSANKGESILPLRDSASGGEMSRVMLAIELSSEFNIDQTAVFDEIDTGTGGKAGDKIGKKLEKLSKQKQVFSITHLAQAAAFADTHIKIYKDVEDSRTFTRAKTLSQEEHIEEIARMISGEQITQSALEHAKSLIQSAKS
ncbi:MAG: DNA repair protein RecN [Elusimicrobiota bacterium]|jgi:DNA repair protein RecN (Recombination protein N)|nr:DNA repair protein RecN [Elusimicrobiota bacterium]